MTEAQSSPEQPLAPTQSVPPPPAAPESVAPAPAAPAQPAPPAPPAPPAHAVSEPPAAPVTPAAPTPPAPATHAATPASATPSAYGSDGQLSPDLKAKLDEHPEWAEQLAVIDRERRARLDPTKRHPNTEVDNTRRTFSPEEARFID